jgi:hypothetical protein
MNAVQVPWRLASSGTTAPDALVIAQLRTRGAQPCMVLALLLGARLSPAPPVLLQYSQVMC